MFKKYEGDVLDSYALGIYLSEVQKMIDRLHIWIDGL